MVPEHEAQIGPPGIELQPANGDIKIRVSPPEANQGKKMWLNDLSFKYNLVFWENSSSSQVCGNIPGTRCNVSSVITTTGFYYLRVQARAGHNKSCLSTEVKVDPLKTNEIGPPGVKLDISDTLLHIQISPPGGPEGETMRNNYVLSYRILYWKNSSNDEQEAKAKETKQTVATIPDLEPQSWYCVKAQALSEAYNKSSVYSQEECIQTPAEKAFPLIILATFMAALFAVLLVALPLVFVLYQAYSKIKYVFFPSCQPPLNIEGFGGELCTSPYLSTPEEPIENYSIIDSMITNEGNQIDCKGYKHSKQSSRDSGNYSNDDNTSGSKGSAETLEKEIV
ncbi:interferon alpha/beta receptor 1 [Neopelma chrysocephalum]|uniref:interferon alpha/beta receptor 1 n=1 Tax=Neopelma chrysocephalum TaxID=114329 RepID=UPI000FCCE5B5|nr:interferon alpha/beta receptor 1 [Neopelma chrysocephalum]